MSEPTVADTRRLNSKPQDLTDAYGPPSNFLEIDVYDPQTVGVGRNRFTTYEVRMRVGTRLSYHPLSPFPDGKCLAGYDSRRANPLRRV